MYFPDFQAFFFVKSFPVCLIYIFSCHVGLSYSVLQPLLISLDLTSLMLSTPSIIGLLDWNNVYFIVLMVVPGVLVAVKCVSFIYPVLCIRKPNKVEICLYTHGIRLPNRHVWHSEVHSQATRTVLHTSRPAHTGNKSISPLKHPTHIP
jgi:hypothetical protein